MELTMAWTGFCGDVSGPCEVRIGKVIPSQVHITYFVEPVIQRHHIHNIVGERVDDFDVLYVDLPVPERPAGQVGLRLAPEKEPATENANQHRTMEGCVAGGCWAGEWAGR